MSVFSGRYIIVVKAALAGAANQVAAKIDPDGGSATFGAPTLRRVGTTAATSQAVWASLVVTPEQAAYLDGLFKSAAQVAKAVIEPGEVPPAWGTGKVWAFRADEALDNAWTPDAVLAALGLELIPGSTT